MRRAVVAVAHAVAALAAVLLLVLPVTRYAWVRAVEPTTAPADIVDRGGDVQVAASLLLMAGVGAALVAMRTARNRRARGLALVVGLVVAATWAWRFGR